MNKLTKEIKIKVWVFLCLWMSVMVVPAALANNKIVELNQKIADMNLLHQQLIDRSDQVQSIRAALLNQKNSLTAEITILSKSLQLSTYTDANRHLRIRYNLELLRSIIAYLDEMDIKWLFYQNGLNKLQYLRQLAEDDIKMIATLNDLKIEALVTQISLVVNRYLPDAHVIQIDVNHIVSPSAITVWEEILARK